MSRDASASPAVLRALIIGTGFGGLGMAIQLQKAGICDFLLLEKEGEVGGCWRDNGYPGAACDVPSHLYSFSFEPKADWTRRFAPQSEIFEYLKHCADKYGLRPFIRFHQEVSEARFDEVAGVWEVSTKAGDVFRTRALISACGQLNRPAIPRIHGAERFAGEQFHSARWRADYDVTAKRVAVIGTGASAIQIVPSIAEKVGQLFVFQRSAAYVIAKPDRAYRPWERALLARTPWVQRLARALLYVKHEWRVLPFSLMPSIMKAFQLSFRRHLARGIKDKALRARLVPDYPLGCKRILISNDYYPALARPNVELVTDDVRALTERGIVTADGREREVDAVVYCTGFTAADFLAPMRITGLGGRDLNQAWRDGAEAYLGITVSGFPNLFLLYGPNTNLGHNSIVYMLESQIRYVLGCLRALEKEQLRYLDVRAQVQEAFNERLQRALRRTVWEQGCTSWYKTDGGKNTNNWPGFTFRYRQLTRAPTLEHYVRVR